MKKTIYIAKDPINYTNQKKATLGGNLVSFEHRESDYYGNPLYRVYPVSTTFHRLESVYRNYESKGYWLIQSYGIEIDLVRLLEEIDSKLPVPSSWVNFEENYGEGYAKLEVSL